MELTFDYQDIKEALDVMGITIHNVYFGASTISPKNISVHMYWISPANQFNYYQEIPFDGFLDLKIKGKWFGISDLDKEECAFEANEKIDWIKTQTQINCRYFIDSTGTGTIGSYDQDN